MGVPGRKALDADQDIRTSIRQLLDALRGTQAKQCAVRGATEAAGDIVPRGHDHQGPVGQSSEVLNQAE